MIIQEKENTIKEKDAKIKDLQEMISTLKTIREKTRKMVEFLEIKSI